MNSFPYFPFYPADYLSDEKVKLMSITAEGVYLRLLLHQWEEGSIPSDRSAIALLCKGYDGPAIDEALACFKPSRKNGRLVNPRLEKERKKIEELYKSKKTAGLKGAEKRWHSHNSANAKAIAKHSYSESESDTESDKEKKKKNISPIPVIRQTIEYLNQKTGKKFSATATATVRHITARINEGRTLEDFQRVIDIKALKWGKDPRMNDYLRPETLFGSKMESYLNEFLILSDVEKERLVGNPANYKLTPEQEARIPDLKKEYAKLADEYCRKKGLKSVDDIDPFEFPFEREYIDGRLHGRM